MPSHRNEGRSFPGAHQRRTRERPSQTSSRRYQPNGRLARLPYHHLRLHCGQRDQGQSAERNLGRHWRPVAQTRGWCTKGKAQVDDEGVAGVGGPRRNTGWSGTGRVRLLVLLRRRLRQHHRGKPWRKGSRGVGERVVRRTGWQRSQHRSHTARPGGTSGEEHWRHRYLADDCLRPRLRKCYLETSTEEPWQIRWRLARYLGLRERGLPMPARRMHRHATC